jgi:RimJ/RimL family protein N-acetyltransferase
MLPESARLQFREMSPDDLDDMAALLGDPEVMTYYPAPRTRAQALQWIEWSRGLYRSRGYGPWIISVTASGEFAGDCGLTPQLIDGREELEVGARRLTAIIHPDNRPSQRVAEKIGLKPEKRTRDRTGKDVVLYAADW